MEKIKILSSSKVSSKSADKLLNTSSKLALSSSTISSSTSSRSSSLKLKSTACTLHSYNLFCNKKSASSSSSSSLSSNCKDCESKTFLVPIYSDLECEHLSKPITSASSTCLSSLNSENDICRSRLYRLIHSIGLCIVYLIVTQVLIGLSGEHILLIIVFIILYNGPSYSHKFILSFSVFIIYWIIFDYMKALPNYLIRPVAIESLYNAEKLLFGFCYNGKRITHNEYWQSNESTLIILLCGIFYLMWIPLPLSMAIYLYVHKVYRKYYYQFALNFLLINLIGFSIYYIYPAAPPWYIQEYGLSFNSHISPNSAKLAQFDKLLGIPIFKQIYSKSSNIFATMPSLHVSYPLLVLIYGLKLRFHPLIIIAFSVAFIGISFTAVYASHHYILDVLAGIITSILGFIIFQLIIGKTLFGNKILK